MIKLEIGAKFTFEFFYINAEEDSVCSATGTLDMGTFPTVEQIQKAKDTCDAQIEEQTGGEYQPVTTEQMAILMVKEVTGGAPDAVGGVDPEWASPGEGHNHEESSEEDLDTAE